MHENVSELNGDAWCWFVNSTSIMMQDITINADATVCISVCKQIHMHVCFYECVELLLCFVYMCV